MSNTVKQIIEQCLNDTGSSAESIINNIHPHVLIQMRIAELQVELMKLGFEFGALNFMSFAPQPITCMSRQEFIEINFHSNFLTIENTAKMNSQIMIKYEDNWQDKCIHRVKGLINV